MTVNTRKAQIIGFCGRKRHGKDTAANALAALGYTKIGLADPIKEALLMMDPIVVARQSPFGFTNDKIYPISWMNRLSKLIEVVGWEEAKEADDVRHYLQALGTEFGRDIVPRYNNATYGSIDVWSRIALEKIEAQRSFCENAKLPPPMFAITGIRFEDHGTFIKNLGGLLVHVYRPGMEVQDGEDVHASEKMAVEKMADFEVINSGTVQELHRKVLDIFGYDNFDIACESHCGNDCAVECANLEVAS